ncbi:MAG: hypothetical protein Q8N23_08910 [Archangium sp.]|nr:hypothetical protein [Archangium sp.]MDP3152777.1 hypothetical protein [Archangium sp.]MDP3573564.1 hypothetical protein [Archangium sp.]
MDSRRTTLSWLLVAFAVFGVGTLVSRFKSQPAEPAPSWQKPISELTVEQQRFYRELRAQLRAAERERGTTKRWPAPAGIFADGWVQRRQGLYVNYLGEREGLRWLVLFIEPDPRAAPEKAPPEDDEHHTLSDGTALHVTVWTQPVNEPATERVTAFPAAEGWVERVAR